MRKIPAFSVMFVFVMAFAAAAQFGGKAQQGPNFYADFKPVVGGWAEYRMTPQKEAPTRMKVAIVGKEGPAYWYETQLNAGGNIVTKVLVSGDPKDQKNVKRMIMKQGSEPAMEMPVMSRTGSVKTQQPEGKVIDKGMEKITVPAGTFTARHVRYQQGKDVVDTWVSDKVSPYGMVKTKSKDMEMVLLGYGSGAKSLITEKPRKFQMPKMPQGMPKGMVPGMNLPDQE